MPLPNLDPRVTVAAAASAGGPDTPAAQAVPERDRAALERAVTARAREFDAGALLAVLAELGYRDQDIVLRSRHGTSRSGSLLHEVTFEQVPRPCVVITVNLGLLGSESPLPSYMLKLAEESTDRLVPFFEYFDHFLLRSRFGAQWPERAEELGCDWN